MIVLVQQVVFGNPVWVGGDVVNLTMLQDFVDFGNLDNVFWSLTVELAFYVIEGLLFAAGRAHRSESRLVEHRPRSSRRCK